MSRTIRRVTGYRPWAKPEVDVEYFRGTILQLVCVNYNEWREYESKAWYKPKLKKVEKIYRVREVPTSVKLYVGRKTVDEEYKRKMESDWGNFTPSRNYKEAVRKQRRACEKTELYKIKESCYTGFDDVYEYDISYEHTFQRHSRWVYY